MGAGKRLSHDGALCGRGTEYHPATAAPFRPVFGKGGV